MVALLRSAGLVLAIGMVAATPAWAGTACSGPSFEDGLGPLVLRQVTAEEKVSFVGNPDRGASCPDAGKACQLGAFVLRDDQLLVSRSEGGYDCATFVSDRGRETSGWLPVKALEDAPADADWTGAWKRGTSAEIRFAEADGDGVTVSGNATYETGGTANVGEFVAAITPSGTRTEFATDGDKAVPIASADENTCRIAMAQLGPYLVVRDNNRCGGLNVSFTGIYTRR